MPAILSRAVILLLLVSVVAPPGALGRGRRHHGLRKKDGQTNALVDPNADPNVQSVTTPSGVLYEEGAGRVPADVGVKEEVAIKQMEAKGLQPSEALSRVPKNGRNLHRWSWSSSSSKKRKKKYYKSSSSSSKKRYKHKSSSWSSSWSSSKKRKHKYKKSSSWSSSWSWSWSKSKKHKWELFKKVKFHSSSGSKEKVKKYYRKTDSSSK